MQFTKAVSNKENFSKACRPRHVSNSCWTEDSQKEILKSGLDMLVNREKMGQRFKFLPYSVEKSFRKIPRYRVLKSKI
jgi:SAM-dependent MidA family methyltransferase